MKRLSSYIFVPLILCNITFAYADDDNQLEQAVKKVATEWKVEHVVAGNIKHTNKAYVAAILSKDAGNTVTLRIYMREANNNLRPIVDAPNAVCANCGGPAGEQIPYSLSMNKSGVLDIMYEGGSSTGITSESKWRYQNGDFYLIGMTETVYDKMSDDHWYITRDSNFSTLKMTEKHHLPNDNKTLTCDISQKFKNNKLSSYTSDANMPKCSNADLPN